jgi:hypothetical protein
LSFEVLGSVSEERWRAVLDASPGATVFQTPEWSRVLAETYGYRPATRLYETDAGDVLIPMMEMQRLGFRILSSMPLGYGGVFTTAPVDTVVGPILKDLVRGRTLKLYLTLPPRSGMTVPSIPGLVPYGSDWNDCQIVDLDGGAEGVVARASRIVRRQIRGGIRCGVETTVENTLEGYRAFYEIYTARSREWGYAEPPYPFRLFEAIHRHLGPMAQLIIARLHDDIVGGQLLLIHGSTASAWLIAWKRTDPDCHQSSMLIRHALAESRERGARFLNLGSSGQLNGVRAYKASWGAVPVPVQRFVCHSNLKRLLGTVSRPRSDTFPAISVTEPDDGSSYSN